MGLFRRGGPAPEPPRVEGPLTPELVRRVAEDHLAPAEVDVLVAALRPSLRLVHADGRPVVGRLGGPAHLAGGDWPVYRDRPLSVVASLDCAALSDHGLPDLSLPPDGTLTFFYDVAEQSTWGFDPADRGSWRVVHAVGGGPADAPDGALVLPEVPLAAERGWTVPAPEEPVLEELPQDGVRAVAERLPEVVEPAHRLGGWPDPVQGPMWLGAQLASSGVYVGGPEGYRDPRVPALAAGAADWRLLLQVDSDDDADVMWGDTGRLYFLGRVQHLRRGELGDGWFELQCS